MSENLNNEVTENNTKYLNFTTLCIYQNNCFAYGYARIPSSLFHIL